MFDWSELWVWRTAFVVCLLGMLALSLMPDPATLTLLSTGWDKSNHALAFFLLGMLGSRAFPGPAWRLAVGLLGYGVLIEALQGMTTWRTAEWQDLLADMVGISAALGAFAVLRRAYRRAA
jgi:VanZ family protein